MSETLIIATSITLKNKIDQNNCQNIFIDLIKCLEKGNSKICIEKYALLNKCLFNLGLDFKILYN